MHGNLSESRGSRAVADESHDQSAFAIYIRMARAALGWSQHDLARMLGMTQRSVNRIELGHCEPRRTTIMAMESLLRKAGLKVEYSFDGSVSVTVPAAAIDKHGAACDRKAEIKHPQPKLTQPAAL